MYRSLKKCCNNDGGGDGGGGDSGGNEEPNVLTLPPLQLILHYQLLPVLTMISRRLKKVATQTLS